MTEKQEKVDVRRLQETRLRDSSIVGFLKAIVKKDGEPQDLLAMPVNFTVAHAANNLFTAAAVGGTVFRHFLLPAGVEFLRSNGIEVDPNSKCLALEPIKEEATPTVVKEVWVQRKDRTIKQCDPGNVPQDVIRQLKIGVLTVFDGELYGTSREHLLGE